MPKINDGQCKVFKVKQAYTLVKVCVMKFKVLIERDENGRYIATVPSLPGCISQGKTEGNAKKNIKEAIKLHLSALVEEGVPIKPPKEAKETTVAVTI